MQKPPHGFRPGQSAHSVHQSLKTSLEALEKAQQCAVLWFGEILERKLYRELGYGSINQYAKLELGFSTSRTGDFLQLCRKLKSLPKVKAKVESGELGYTAARVIAPVADKSNEQAWVDFALNNSRRELEREVKRARVEAADRAAGQMPLMPVTQKRPAAVVPVRVNLEMSPAQFARYEALWERVRKQGDAPSDKVEAMLEMMASFVEKSSPRGEHSQPPVQVHVHQCPDCGDAAVQTSKGELKLGAAETERLQCDCQISQTNERNTTSIPPATRRKVLARDRHQCQRPGCDHTRYLEVHHKAPRTQGGSNEQTNLTTLCSACHQLLHEIGVKEPAGIYQYKTGAPTRRAPVPSSHQNYLPGHSAAMAASIPLPA